MIKVDRTECPNILKEGLVEKSEGEIETLDAIVFYSDDDNLELKYQRMGKRGKRIKKSFSVYSEDDVRIDLNNMFNGKCAYCESEITSIYNGDIEHFRPKGAVNNFGNSPTIKPGYFWLAAQWDNLLFSCPHCNQTNTHEISEDGDIKNVVLGKLNQFPLNNQGVRLNRRHGLMYFVNRVQYNEAFEEEEFQRLLLKPCTDEVERFFIYDNEGVIRPSGELDDFETLQAEKSIEVLALQRLPLVQKREKKVVEIKAQIRRVEEAIITYNRYSHISDEEKTRLDRALQDELNALHKFKLPDEEYSGMAKHIINNYFIDFSKT